MKSINKNVNSKRYTFFLIMVFAIKILRTAMSKIALMSHISIFYFSNVFEKTIEN